MSHDLRITNNISPTQLKLQETTRKKLTEKTPHGVMTGRVGDQLFAIVEQQRLPQVPVEVECAHD